MDPVSEKQDRSTNSHPPPDESVVEHEKKEPVTENGVASEGGYRPSMGAATVPDVDEHASGEDDEEDDEEGTDADGPPLELTQSRAKDLWKFHFRPPDDDEPE